MSIVTKELASNLAKKICEKANSEAQKLLEEISKELTEICMKDVPDEVKEVFKKYPTWIDQTWNVQMHGTGWNYEWFNVGPVPAEKGHRINLTIENKALNDAILKKWKSYEKQIDKIKSLKREYENCFLQLRTFKKVEAAFPELKNFLPQKENNMQLIPAIDKLQQQLPKLIGA